MKTLKGHGIHPSDYLDIEIQLRKLFYQVIYKPILDILAPHNAQIKAARASLKKEIRNAKYDPIVDGINSGKIQYVDSIFSGDFNAAISKALRSYGAKFNKRTKTYAVLEQQLPPEVLAAARDLAQRAKGYHESLEKKLTEMVMTMTYQVGANPIDAKKTINKMSKKFQEQYGDALGTEGLSESSKEKLNRAYQFALKPYISKFGSEQIFEIRELVAENAKTGYRFDTLISKIEQRYGVSQSKAEFLARQETSMFVSKAREARFGDVGITKYIWRTAGDSEVRPDHKKLDGREFEYSKPPIVDIATGRRGNAGEDYNCRCIAEPVLPEVFA